MPVIFLTPVIYYNMSEYEFAKMVKEIEEEPLFKKLMYPENRREKAIKYERLSRTDISSNFYELKEETIRDSRSPDIELLIAEKKEILNLARGIGEKKFKKYFLYCENAVSLKQTAGECNLSISEVKKLMELVNNVSLYNEFYHPSTLSLNSQVHYTKVASVSKNGSERGCLLINFFSPQWVRGIYKIDYDKLEYLKSGKNFSEEELKRLNGLIKDIELINTRKTTLYKVLQGIVEKQKTYFNSGDISNLQPQQQKELAEKINIDSSLVCRAIKGRSIDTPQGEEKPLKFFFSGEKAKIESALRNIMTRPYTDEQISDRLKKQYKINRDRRTVREYRNKLKISSGVHWNKNNDKK